MYSVQILDRSTNRVVIGADVSLIDPAGNPMGNMRTGETGVVGTERPVPHGSYWEVRHQYFSPARGGAVEGRSTIYLDRSAELIPDSVLGNEATGEFSEVQAQEVKQPGAQVQNQNANSSMAPGASGFLGIPFPLLLLGGAAALYFVNKYEEGEKNSSMNDGGDPYQPIEVKDDMFGEE